MDYHKDLYKKQYWENKLIITNSFRFFRETFKKFDLHREDLVLGLPDGGNRLLDLGGGDGSSVCTPRDRFYEVYGIDISPSRTEGAKKNALERFGVDNKMRFATCNINEEIDFPDGMFHAATSIDPYLIEVQLIVY